MRTVRAVVERTAWMMNMTVQPTIGRGLLSVLTIVVRVSFLPVYNQIRLILMQPFQDMYQTGILAFVIPRLLWSLD